MDKLKRFIDCYVPTETCNLRCHYCYITQHRKFNNKLVSFDYPVDYMRKALSKERLGGTCLLNLCAGGETLLSQDVLDFSKAILEEGHYLMIVTNGTLSKRFDEIVAWDSELLSRLFFKFSFHYLELKRLNLFHVFFENVKKAQKAGCSFTVEITPSDELIPHIEDIKNMCMNELGVLCQITVARNEQTQGIDYLSSHSWEEYQKIWSVFDSPLFKFKTSIWAKKQKDFCYAGDWSLSLDIKTGNLLQCLCGKKVDNIYEDINRPIYFEAIGKKCSLPHCFNGHAYLTLGTIPNLKTITFAEVRDRVQADGMSWLTPRFSSFISQKLEQNNEKYSFSKRWKCNRSGLGLKYKIKRIPLVASIYKKFSKK